MRDRWFTLAILLMLAIVGFPLAAAAEDLGEDKYVFKVMSRQGPHGFYKELCHVTQKGDVERGKFFKQMSCDDFRKAIALTGESHRAGGDKTLDTFTATWLCWLLDPCAQAFRPAMTPTVIPLP